MLTADGLHRCWCCFLSDPGLCRFRCDWFWLAWLMVFVSCRLCVWFILLKSVWLWYCLLESVWFLGGLGSWNNDVGFGYGVIVMVWVRLGIVGICWGCVFDDIMGIWGRCGFCVWDVVLCRLLLFNYDDCVGFWQLCDSVLFCCVSAGSTYSEQIRVFKKKNWTLGLWRRKYSSCWILGLIEDERVCELDEAVTACSLDWTVLELKILDLSFSKKKYKKIGLIWAEKVIK